MVLPIHYNADGIRASKTASGSKHTYTLNGSQIVSEAWGNHLLIYLYDESGAPIGMQYRTQNYAEGVFDTYYFEKNLQGDIIAVYDATVKKLGSYTYDAWGYCTTSFPTNISTAERRVVNTLNPSDIVGTIMTPRPAYTISRAGITTRRWGGLSMRMGMSAQELG